MKAHLKLVQAQGWLQYYNQFKQRQLHNSNTTIRNITLKEAYIRLPFILQKNSIIMAEENENHNAKETMNVQELLNTMVASQIQLREDMNAIVQ